MRLLVDTHLLLWALSDAPQLKPTVRAILLEPANELYFSSISIAETAIKFARKQPDFVVSSRDVRRELLANGYAELWLESVHAEAIERLPPVHKDPFDRLLIAQAMVEGMPLLTGDAALAAYGGVVRLV